MNLIEKKAKKLQAQYHRQWRSKNKEKVKEINKRYWLKKAQEQLKAKEDT